MFERALLNLVCLDFSLLCCSILNVFCYKVERDFRKIFAAAGSKPFQLVCLPLIHLRTFTK